MGIKSVEIYEAKNSVKKRLSVVIGRIDRHWWSVERRVGLGCQPHPTPGTGPVGPSPASGAVVVAVAVRFAVVAGPKPLVAVVAEQQLAAVAAGRSCGSRSQT
ncbi:hypothetical protein C453_02469 [Haloferax elongans ATCC BAA-1513]|uniref:Uncharacterized protein n=1 Tax=Haloferax elongans ATCC BAA-1513 TaxID=1230453 RepID=M0HTT6_HALEO|nr:hypothetical protein [Haloferax elongans]ELZ87178.1 hypothetical protein C453_02469 [Haloferax elongans ATCC BAA-1513]